MILRLKRNKQEVEHDHSLFLTSLGKSKIVAIQFVVSASPYDVDHKDKFVEQPATRGR